MASGHKYENPVPVLSFLFFVFFAPLLLCRPVRIQAGVCGLASGICRTKKIWVKKVKKGGFLLDSYPFGLLYYRDPKENLHEESGS